ncbi:unnamed protein product [Closterium sp. NIES-53]
MASLRVLAFYHEGRPVQFDTWLDDLQLYLLSDSKDSVSLFDLASGAATAPPATVHSSTRSQLLTRDADARLAIRNHLPLAECAHFGQHGTAQALYDAIVALQDLVSHLCASDACYRAAGPAEFLDRNPPPMDHFLYLDPTSLTVDLLEQYLLAAETSAVAVGAARGTPRPPFFEGCFPSPLASSYASAAAADVSVPEDVGAASPSVKRRSSKDKGGRGGGGDSGGGGGGSRSGGGGSSGGGGGGATVGESGGSGGGGGGSGGSGSSGGGGTGARRVGSGGGQRQQQQRQSETPSPQQLLWYSPGTAHAKALHTFTLDSGTSRCFFRDSTTLTPLPASAPVRLADPSGGPVVARSSTILPCPAVPSGSLSGRHLPSFYTNFVSTAALDDAMVTTTTPGGQRVSICTCTRTGRHLATFTCRPGSSLYTLTTEPSHVAASAQVSASGQVAASCSCRLLSHQTLLWHHRQGHPSLPRLRGMHSRLLVSGLPRSLSPRPPSPAPPCLPCVEGRQRAAPHSSSFPPTTAPLQTLHMDVWGPARVSGQSRERYFLLVVDDYARYTTVFPLRSKSRVVDVLIPWIRTVRLLLLERFDQDLPLLRLHSDRGGEFSSTLLRDFCRGEGILQSFTLPDFPQKNGIVERRIGLVMELNLWPRVSLPETSPTLRWTREVGDASVFRFWGSRAFVRDTSADKVSPHAIPCVFLGFVLDAPGWQFYHPTSRRVFPSEDVTFDESVPFESLFPYRSAPPPPMPLFLAPGPPPVDPLPPQGHAPSGVSQVDPLSGPAPLHVAVDLDATRGAASGGAVPGGAESEGSETGGPETGGAKLGGVATGGAELGGAASEGAESGGAEPQGAASSGGTAGASPRLSPQQLRARVAARAGAGVTRGTTTTGPGGARTRGTGAAGTGGVEGAGARVLVESGTTGTGGAGAGGAGVGGPGAGGAWVGGPGVGGARAGGAGAVDPGGAMQPRAYFYGGLTELREPASRPVSLVRTAHRVPRSHPPLDPGMHAMTLRPSSIPLRVPLPAPPESSLPEVPDHNVCSVAELLDFAAACRLDYATALVAKSASASPPSVGGECALGTDVLEDRQEDFESLAAAVPRFASMLLAPEGDPDAPDIPTPRSYAEAITGPYSSQWQAAMDAEMASWKSTRTYVDEVPPPGANIVDGMWIFRVKRPPGSPPAFKARYIARGFSQRQGVDYFQTFSPTPKMTTLRVLLHVATQRDYELHSLDFITAFLLHWPVYGLRQVPREWHDTLRTTLAALGFAPATADLSLFLRTDTSLPTFYVLVYVDDLVFATADTEALTRVKSELQKRHTCTDLGPSGLRLPVLLATAHSSIYQPLALSSTFGRVRRAEWSVPIACGLPHVPDDVHSTRPRVPSQPPAPGRHRKVHWDAVKRVLHYSGMGLVLGGRGPVVLTGHADASWFDDSATQQSSQGYTFSLGFGSVSWRSTRSSSILSFSCEAEIYARAMGAEELRWLTYLLTDLGEQPRLPRVLYVDNKAMIALCQEHRLEHITKHIALRYFLAQELQQRGQLRLAYVATRANTADVFTKALPPGDHQRFVTVLGLLALLFLIGLDLVELDDSGPKAWKLLRDLIQPNTLPMVIVLEKELAALSMRPGDDVKPVLDKIKDTYARMAAAGRNVSQMQQCTKIFSVLKNSWDNLIPTINTHQDQWTPEWLRQQILLEDFRRHHTGGGAANKTAEGCRAKLGNLLLWDSEEKSSCIKDLWQLPIIPWNGKPPATAALAAMAKATAKKEKIAQSDGVVDTVKKVQQPQQPHGEVLAGVDATAAWAKASSGNGDVDWETWHERLCHINIPMLKNLVKDGILKGIGSCPTCLETKFAKFPFSSGTGPTRAPLALVHMDVVGLTKAPSLSGSRYFLTIVDDHTRAVWVYPLKTKGEVAVAVLKEWMPRARRESGHKVKMIRTDNGGEFIGADFEAELKNKGIQHQLTVPYNPQQTVWLSGSTGPYRKVLALSLGDWGKPEQQQQQQDAPPRPERLPDRPRRDVRPPNRLTYPCFGKPKVVRAGSVAERCDQEEIAHCYWASVPEPKTLAEVLSGADAEKWKQSVKEEYDSLLENKRWELSELPPGKKAISSKLIFRHKYGPDGEQTRYKSRLVAEGFQQTKGKDFDEIFALVGKGTTLRVMLGTAANRGWRITQMDITTAFLNGIILEELYMQQPEGLDDGSGRVCRLKKAIYGLKQAPRAWYHKLEETLLAGGFRKSECDHSLFLLQEKNGFLMLLVYMDDVLLFFESSAMIGRVEEMLEMQFKCSKIGDVKYYLGMHVERDLDKGVLRLHQRKYCERLAGKYGLQDGGKPATPLPSGFTVEPCADEERLQRGAADLSKGGMLLTCYTDASFNSVKADGTSIGGYVRLFGGGAVSWHSKKQNEVGLSSCETEFMALHHRAKEVVWLEAFVGGDRTVPVGADNNVL